MLNRKSAAIKLIQASALAVALCLAAVLPAAAQGPQLNVTLFGGYALPLASDAIIGRDGDSGPSSSSFSGGLAVGLETVYRFPVGVSVGLGVGYVGLDCDAARSGSGESEWASLRMIPLYVLGKYDHAIGKGFDWFGEAGLGYSFNNTLDGDGVKAVGTGMGSSSTLETSNSFMFLVGTGVKYNFAKGLAAQFGVRYWWTQADSDLVVAGMGTVSKNTFVAHNVQALLGMTYTFDLDLFKD